MTELLEALNDIIKSGIEFSTVIVVIVAILKVYEGRKQRKIEEEMRDDLKAIKKELNIWDAATLTAASRESAMRRSVCSRLYTTTLTIARGAGKFIKWRERMMTINKAILIPLVSAITGFIKDSTGYVVPNEYADLAVNLLLYLIIPIIGALMHPRKKGDDIDNAISASIESAQ